MTAKIPQFFHYCYLITLISYFVNYSKAQNGRPGFKYTTYEEGIVCSSAKPPLSPKTLKELQVIVDTALRTNYSVKALGNRHSGTDVICTDDIPINMLDIDHFRYDTGSGLATVGAGSTVGALLDRLHREGRTTYGIPSYEDITVGGALGTGSHGTDFHNPATFSDQVVGVVIVDGLGNVRNITDHGTLRAFRAHLGLLGILYEVTVVTVPQYKLQIRNYPESDRILFEGNKILQLAASSDRLQIYWFPTAKTAIMSVGSRVPTTRTGNCQTYLISEAPRPITALISETLEAMQEGGDRLGYFTIQSFTKLSLYQQVPGKSPIFTADGKTLCEPAIGYSHRMSANRCIECAWNQGNASVFELGLSVVIPSTELPEAVETVREIMADYPADFPLTGIYLRFLSPSDGLLTVNSGRRSVSLEWQMVSRKDRFNKPMLGLETSQALVQALITKHDGRPHWGKTGLTYLQQPVLLQRYPNLPYFIQLMEEFDPHGVFLNDFGRRLRFGLRKTALDSHTKHCALVENCICENDRDCGDGSPGSYRCAIIVNYKVCKENAGEYASFRNRIVRKFVGKLKER